MTATETGITATVDYMPVYAANGRYIRRGTQVTFSDGTVINYSMDRLSKTESLRQAWKERNR